MDMDFAKHRGNLIDWIYFAQAESGLERDAQVLLHGEQEDLQVFSELLKPRVKRLSYKLDERRYDYILIPVLTEKLLSPFQGSLSAMLRDLAENLLLPGGRILLAAENRGVIDRMLTGKYEEGLHYTDHLELGALRKEMKRHFPEAEDMLYYPFPSLSMPIHFYTDERLPKRGEEGEAAEELVRLGLFSHFAPAYIYILQPKPLAKAQRGRHAFTPIFIRYNSSRRPEYAIKTEILKDRDGRLHVLKESIRSEGNAHIEELLKNGQRLRKRGGLPVLSQEAVYRSTVSGNGLSSVLYPYVVGKSLSEILGDLIRDGEAPVQEIQEAMDLLLGQAAGKAGADAENLANLDILFSNVLMDGESPVLIDCEWVLDEEVESRFLEYRILKYWYEDYKDALSADFLSFLRPFGFREEDAEAYEELERDFQKMVHGEGEESNVYVFQSRQASVRTILPLKRRLVEQEGDRVWLQKKLARWKPPMKKEEELLRLSRIHVANLNELIETHQADIGRLQADLHYFKEHESYRSQWRKEFETAVSKRFPEGSKDRKVLEYAFKTALHPVQMGRMYFTPDGWNRIRGDFAEGLGEEYLERGKVPFPAARRPLVSIIIPCYNQILYTYHCLWSIYEHTDFAKTPYEIIIADDVSTDGTKEIRYFADNLVIARNKTNQGFLRNCNQAAKRARGRYLFFLNNDTTVCENWLQSLVDLIEGDESIGMVGSKLVYPDGRLQEAGGIIWSDASGWNYGRLQDPSLPEYNYVKDVDYISGAAIMIRHSLWREIGGFDERFAPAYFEDSDLAFEVRRHGKRVVFQPLSVVVHYEGVSNGTDVNGPGLKRYQLLNLSKFKAKWKDELKKQYVNDGDPNSFRARERGRGKKYILVVDHYVPTWDRDAGSKTTYQYLQLFLSRGFRIKFLGDNFQHEEPYSTILSQMGIEILYGPDMYYGIWKWIKGNHGMIDYVYFNRPDITDRYLDHVRKYTKWKCIFYGHDLHFLREYREYQLTGNEKSLRDSERSRELELSVMRRTDMNYYPSEVEAEAIRAIDPSIPVKAITAYIFSEKAEIREDYAGRQGLLFVGGFGHPPNKDGILWFVNEILPRVREAIPDIKLNIVGSKADGEILALSQREGVHVLGFVSDARLHEIYQESRMVIVPLRFGAGVKGKVVEALHEGAAIVTTPCGAEGIPDVGEVLDIAEDEEAFARAIIRLYPDTAALQALSKKAAAFAAEHFSPDAAWEVIREDFA